MNNENSQTRDTVPALLSLATASPPHILHQDEIAAEARRQFADSPVIERMMQVFQTAGIRTRQSVCPLDWFRRDLGWPERSQAFMEGAIPLYEEAALAALSRAGLEPRDVDCVITVCSTGIATPSLEAHVLNRMGLRDDVRRVPVFGLGCAGGVTGLSLAARLARAEPNDIILLVVIETCTLSFRPDDPNKSNIVATALFGDGAAAAVITARPGPRPLMTLRHHGEHTWPGSLDVMGWQIDPAGFGAIFSRDIPTLIRERLRAAADAFLARLPEGERSPDITVFHPGGAKVIDALEAAFELPQGTLNTEREILRDHGNMSAPTVLFVLEKRLRYGLSGSGLMSALGPGFTASFLTLAA